MAIATATKRAKLIVQEWGPKMKGGLAKAREDCRTLVAAEIREIDEQTVHLLGPAKSPEVGAKKEEV